MTGLGSKTMNHSIQKKHESQPDMRSNGQKSQLNFMSKGQKRGAAIDDLPSDISDDEWGEIQKFGQRLHEEQVKR